MAVLQGNRASAALHLRCLLISGWPRVAGAVWSWLEARCARRADFSFWSTQKFPTQRRAIPWEISLRNVKGRESGARNELIMGNGRRFEARKQRLFLPAIARNRCSARDHAVSRA